MIEAAWNVHIINGNRTARSALEPLSAATEMRCGGRALLYLSPIVSLETQYADAMVDGP